MVGELTVINIAGEAEEDILCMIYNLMVTCSAGRAGMLRAHYSSFI
jgi:hypothetical protein